MMIFSFCFYFDLYLLRFFLEQIIVKTMSWQIIFTIIFAVLSPFIIADDPCGFIDPLKGFIDLTSLAATDGKAAYPDRIPSTGFNYSTLILCYFIIYYQVSLNYRI